MPDTRRLFKKTALITLLAVLILAVVGVAAAAFIDSQAPHYRQAVAQRIGEQIDARVSINNLDLRWSWRGPVLHLSGVGIRRDPEQDTTLHVHSLSLQFAFIDLLQGQRLPQSVTLHEPQFVLNIDPQELAARLSGDSEQPLAINWPRLQRIRDVIDSIHIDNADLALNLRLPSGNRRIRLQALSASVHDGADSRLAIKAHARADNGLGEITLNAQIDGSLPDFETAHLRIATQGLAPLSVWRSLAPATAPSSLSGGQTDLTLSADWQAQQFEQARLQLDSAAVHAQQQSLAVLPALKARWRVRPQADDPQVLQATLHSLSAANSAVRGIHASAELDRQQHTLTLRAGDIPAALATPFLRTRFPSLSAADIKGRIRAVDLTLAADSPARTAIAFDAIAVDTARFAAGAISGHFYRHAGHNILRFSGADGAVRSLRFLHGAIPISGLDGQLSWQDTAHGRRFKATRLRLNSGDSSLSLNGHLTLPHSGPPIADLQLHGKTADASTLLRHVPQAPDMPFDELRPWLAQAITAGEATIKGHLDGPLDRLFEDDGKHFGLTISGSGFDLDYKPGWPGISNASGHIQLTGKAMAIAIDQAQMLGVGVGPVKIHIADVQEPVLMLEGTLRHGSAPKMLSFLGQSPLRERFGKLPEVLDVKGEAGLDLKLRIPLKDGLGEVKVNGTIHAHNDRLDHQALPAAIKAINGDIQFSDDGLSARHLQGRLLGVALTTRISPADNDRINITSRGQVALPDNSALLAHYLPDSWLTLGHGSATAEVDLQLDRKGNVQGVTVHSDLRGMALELPPPLHKSAEDRINLKLKLDQHGHLAVDYGTHTHLDLTFEDDDLQRAIILLGTAPAVQPPAANGLWLGGQVPTLALGRWLTTLEKLRGDAPHDDNDDDATGLPFLGTQLAIGTLQIGNRRINDIRLQVTPLDQDDSWKIGLAGPNVDGHAVWQPGTRGHSKISAHLSRLHIDTQSADAAQPANSATRPQASLADFDPRDLPGLDLRIDQLHIGTTDFGQARVKAAANDEGWTLQQARLAGGALDLKASGNWQRSVGMTSGQLVVDLDGHGLSNLVRAAGFSPPIQAEQLNIQAELQVTPNDNGLDPAALGGTLTLQINNGIIRSVDPGAGRLLGLLNLYVLPRRLKLDFSDVVSQGLEFDQIAGDFKIYSGNAFSDNLTIKTPGADIKIVGRIGLAARDYDQNVTITPKFGSSLTLAGTLLGGPAVGAAVFALQELLQKPLKNASSISYQLQGTWGNPKIVNPHADQ